MIQGKHLFIWNLSAIEGGNVNAIATKAAAAGYQGLCVKILDGITPMNQSLLIPFILACKGKGLEVSTWGYFYGKSVSYATSEANALATQLNDLYQNYGLDTFLIDVEKEYESDSAGPWASAFMNTLTMKISPALALGLCSYRYPNVHPKIPWAIFLAKCQFHAPQVYWEQANNPEAQLDQSYAQLTALKALPFVPVGSAYCNGGWCATPEECVNFATHAEEKSFPAILYWAWHSVIGIEGMWEALAAIDYDPVVIPPPDPDPEPDFPVLIPAHVLATSTPWVNVRKNPDPNATILGNVKPLGNLWITRLYPIANGAQWAGVIIDNGSGAGKDLAGFMAFTWNYKDLLAFGHV